MKGEKKDREDYGLIPVQIKFLNAGFLGWGGEGGVWPAHRPGFGTRGHEELRAPRPPRAPRPRIRLSFIRDLLTGTGLCY